MHGVGGRLAPFSNDVTVGEAGEEREVDIDDRPFRLRFEGEDAARGDDPNIEDILVAAGVLARDSISRNVT
jgi:hypothetical protein